MIAASQKNQRAGEALMYLRHPQTLLVKELLQSNKLGVINQVRGNSGWMPRIDG
jgi:predicted dehydrogenase